MADKKQERRAFDNNFNVADFTLGNFDHKAEQGTAKRDLLDPAYWSHVAERMTPWSEITVRCADGSFYAKFLVLDCGRGWANVKELGWWDLTSSDVARTQAGLIKDGDFDIIHKGPSRKWIVQRKSDQVVIHEGETSKAGAQSWLDDHLSNKIRTDVKEPAEA